MKLSFKQLGWALIILANTQAYAINPEPGLYLGVFAGVSYTPKVQFSMTDYPVPTLTPQPAYLGYKLMGDVALMAGYRYCHWRGEAELLYGGNPYSYLKFSGYTFYTSKTTGIKMGGHTVIGAILVNGFYDFYTPDTETKFVPYLGLGIGYASVRNVIKFYDNGVVITGSKFSVNASTPAAQGIVGLSYYLDDFAAVSVDYRYLTTKDVQPFDHRFNTNSINFTFTGTFNVA